LVNVSQPQNKNYGEIYLMPFSTCCGHKAVQIHGYMAN